MAVSLSQYQIITCIEIVGGYRFKNNAIEIFDKFYLQNNPFADLVDTNGWNMQGSLFGSAFGG